MFRVNYGTGAGNVSAKTLDEAMARAEEGMAYTQKDVTIYDEIGNPLYISHWWGVEPTDEDDVLAKFGESGFYSDWAEV